MIAVVDYGIGNLRSAEKALQHLGADARLTTDAGEISAAAAVVLPGVGNFGACMGALRESGLEAVTRSAAGDGMTLRRACTTSPRSSLTSRTAPRSRAKRRSAPSRR